MSTSWTNEGNGQIDTTGNNLTGNTLSITGAISVGTTINGWNFSDTGGITKPSGATKISVYDEVTFYEEVIFDNLIGVSGNTALINLSINGMSVRKGGSGGEGYIEAEGGLTTGSHGQSQGFLIMHRKNATEFPYIAMKSSNDTTSFLFVADNGTLRISSTEPTADSDGAPV